MTGSQNPLQLPIKTINLAGYKTESVIQVGLPYTVLYYRPYFEDKKIVDDCYSIVLKHSLHSTQFQNQEVGTLSEWLHDYRSPFVVCRTVVRGLLA